MMSFDREKAFGMRLHIPAGTAVRFEPGEEKEIELVQFGGRRHVYGINNLTNGDTTDPAIKAESLEQMKSGNFKNSSE